jgi:methyltransferase-like protein
LSKNERLSWTDRNSAKENIESQLLQNRKGVIVITNTGASAEKKNIRREVEALLDRLSEKFSGIANAFLPKEIG